MRKCKRLWLRAWGPFPLDEYRCWYHLVHRCTDPSHPKFPRYGGRGISVCERWRDDFMQFLSDMGPRPSPKHSLDRRDNDAGYAPENCRWATMTQQLHNTRRMREAVGASLQNGWWTARIKRHGRTVLLGRFLTRDEASLAYDEARLNARIAADIEAMAAELRAVRERRQRGGDRRKRSAIRDDHPPRTRAARDLA